MTATKDSDEGHGVIRAARNARGWTQAELAMRAGASLASVALLERGYRPRHSDVLGRVLNALNGTEPATRPTPIPTIDGVDAPRRAA